VSQVEAVDFSPQMLAQLQSRAKSLAISNVTTTVASLEEFDLPDASVDLIVSSYALHHLRDQDKAALVMRAARWLRPGGRLVIADMMFGRGTSARDRAILRSKAASMLARGPAGWWRIARNLVKFGLRVGSERPASPRVWRSYLERAGFRDVQFEEIIGEAGLVAAKVGDRPAATGEPGGAIPPGGA
jgi:ubiquinone/menaquinone biosynthesis C-methylase UbiE